MPKPVVIVLAAGLGTRMKSSTPKVLHRAAGRTLLGHALAAAQALDPSHTVVVVRHERDAVAAAAQAALPGVIIADQDEVPGTGQAVRCALAAMAQVGIEPQGGIVVMPGDTPLLDGATLAALHQAHWADGNAVTVLTAQVADPTGYGRIVRDDVGQVAAIVEHSDATEDQREIDEINSSVYVFDPSVLAQTLGRVGRDNEQGEVYLTDVVAQAKALGRPVRALISEDASVIQGVNDRLQLQQAAQAINQRRLEQFMLDGVTVEDPSSTWIDADCEIEPDVTILPGTHLAGQTRVQAGAVIGPFTTLTDCQVGRGAAVDRTVASNAVIGPDATVGPFTHLRGGTVLGPSAKAGSFTELKAADVGEGAKVPHLAYVGDATVGPRANIGAGTIFANYDGVAKSACRVGPAARIGSNNVLVAPIDVGAGAYSGAGVVIRGDVPPGALALGGSPQRIVEGWTLRKRPGTDSAQAAESALADDGQPGHTA
jgi:bifunctional UDP-N-acetylglucosamine pyrophosphorylase/glucosamine-1-phosphate N-acetyltransferase